MPCSVHPGSNVLPVEAELQRDFFTTGGSASALRAVFASWPLDECKAWLEDTDAGGLGLALGIEQETMKYFPLVRQYPNKCDQREGFNL